jgi:hypothetical protein
MMPTLAGTLYTLTDNVGVEDDIKMFTSYYNL